MFGALGYFKLWDLLEGLRLTSYKLATHACCTDLTSYSQFVNTLFYSALTTYLEQKQS